MAWVLKNKDVSTALTSASKPEQLEEIVGSLKFVSKITSEIEEKINKLTGTQPAPDTDYRTFSPGVPRRWRYRIWNDWNVIFFLFVIHIIYWKNLASNKIHTFPTFLYSEFLHNLSEINASILIITRFLFTYPMQAIHILWTEEKKENSMIWLSRRCCLFFISFNSLWHSFVG